MRFGDAAPQGIPQQRVIQKMNEYMGRRDYAGAERHLLYWLEEAKVTGDMRGELMLRGEMIGHYRKTGEKEKAFRSIEEALRLLKELDFGDTISAGTTYVNAATAYNAFGENTASLELFRKAREVYERSEYTDPSLLGGLYNNMALACVSLGKYREADDLFAKALRQMENVPGGDLEQAITYLNMAEAAEKEEGAVQAEKKICSYADRALELLTQTKAPQDGYYAFVCEKCAPAFSYYGYFADAQELIERAERIYAQNADRD